jgi:hypothetical protein
MIPPTFVATLNPSARPLDTFRAAGTRGAGWNVEKGCLWLLSGC